MVEWETKTLGEVCDINPKKSEIKNLSLDKNISFLPMKDLGIFERNINVKETKKLSEVLGSYTYFYEDDILLAKVTPCFENGKLGIAKNLTNLVGFGSSEYIVFRPKKYIINEYIFYLLQLDSFRKPGKKLMLGTSGLKRLSKNYIENFEFKFPNSIEEQKRIVKKLDTAFENIDKSIELTRKNLNNSKEVFESFITNLFENSYNKINLEEFVEFKNGLNYDKNSKGELIDIVGVSNFKDYFYPNLDELNKINVENKLDKSYELKENDLLVVRSNGSAHLVGRFLLIDEVKNKTSFSGFTIRLRPEINKVDSKYLCYFLKSSYIRNILTKNSNGVNIKSLNQGLLKNLEIPLPTLKEQEKIVKQLDELQENTKKLEKVYSDKIELLSDLKKSILEQAFNGEL